MKKVRLSEQDIKNIVKNVVNEISYDTVNKAWAKNDKLFSEIEYNFNEFYYSLDKVADSDNRYIQEILNYANQIRKIIDRKKNQANNFDNELSKFDHEKYWNSDEGQEDTYDDKELRYLQGKYNK